MIFPGMQQSKNRISGSSQPKLVERATGQLFILVRDDVSVNGKLYVAPIGQMTSMTSILPDDFKERFEWYVDPANRPIQVGPPEVDAGGAAGPFVPLSVVEAARSEETVEGVPIEQAAEVRPVDGGLEPASAAVAPLDQMYEAGWRAAMNEVARIEQAVEAQQASEPTDKPSAAVESSKNKGGRPKGRKTRKKRKSTAKRAKVGVEGDPVD